ncbi:MAG: hypothetical protein JWR78_923 [Mycobacterium sp.]|jgi:hypothetical protein|nr:hypothetical protein [Mycobacterium sp.]
MLTDAQEAAFQRHLEQTVPYFDAVREAGDLPWFSPGHPRRAEVVEKLGLAEDISQLDFRRALWQRRYRSQPLPPTEAPEIEHAGDRPESTCGNTARIPA